MALVEARCTNCGAKLEVDSAKEAAICPACNSAFIVEKAINNTTNNITNENHITNSNVTIVNNETLSFDNGVFEGETKSGKPHGYGICQYSDGSKYEGNWVAGVRSGEGTITYENGCKWSGVWKKDNPWEGKGVIYDYKTCYYEGEYKNGEPNGEGSFYYDNGKKWSGVLKDGDEWDGDGFIAFFIDYQNEPYQTFEGKIVKGKYDENGEWHCHGHFDLEGVTYDVTNDVLNYILTSSSQPVTIPNGIKSVEENVGGFYDVKGIICPKSLIEFNVSESRYIEKIQTFEAPGITNVPRQMFYYLKDLETVKLENAKTIGKEAFKGCSALKNLNLPKANCIKEEAFYECESLTSLKIPSVKKIAEYAFWDSGLIEVDAPKLEEIGEDAFSNCSNLSIFKAPILKKIGASAFYSTSITEFYSESVTQIGHRAFRDCRELLSVTLPNANLEMLNNENYYYQFVGCKKLSNIHLAQNVDMSKILIDTNNIKSGGCYIATAIYGSYDCPQVWTLRRYRDYTLAETWYGRAFIKTYYAISPTLVKWFGNTTWFKKMWQGKLDRMIVNLQKKGFESTPYIDKEW